MAEKKFESCLSPNTKVKMVYYNKKTFEKFEKIISMDEWRNIEKEKNFNYYAYQIGFN